MKLLTLKKQIISKTVQLGLVWYNEYQWIVNENKRELKKTFLAKLQKLSLYIRLEQIFYFINWYFFFVSEQINFNSKKLSIISKKNLFIHQLLKSRIQSS